MRLLGEAAVALHWALTCCAPMKQHKPADVPQAACAPLAPCSAGAGQQEPPERPAVVTSSGLQQLDRSAQ